MDFALLHSNSVLPLITKDLSFLDNQAFSLACSFLYQRREKYMPPLIYSLLHPEGTKDIEFLILVLKHGLEHHYPQVKRVLEVIDSMVPIVQISIPDSIECEYESCYYLDKKMVEVYRMVYCLDPEPGYHYVLRPQPYTGQGVLILTQPLSATFIRTITIEDLRTPSAYEAFYLNSELDITQYKLFSFGQCHPRRHLPVGIPIHRLPEIAGTWWHLRSEPE